MTALIKLPETLPAGTDRHKTFEATLRAVKALDETALPEDLTGLAKAHNANSKMLKSVKMLIGTLDHTTPAIEWELFETLCVRGRRILATASRCQPYNQADIKLLYAFAERWRPGYEAADDQRIPFMGDGEYILQGRGRCHVTKTDKFINGERLYLVEPRVMENRFWFQEYAMGSYLVGKVA